MFILSGTRTPQITPVISGVEFTGTIPPRIPGQSGPTPNTNPAVNGRAAALILDGTITVDRTGSSVQLDPALAAYAAVTADFRTLIKPIPFISQGRIVFSSNDDTVDPAADSSETTEGGPSGR